MKPLTHCPYCQAPMQRKTIPEELNSLKYELCSRRCTVDYFQYYHQSYEEDVGYITFYTPKHIFHVYSYFKYPFYPLFTHVYSEVEMKQHGKAFPILELKNFAIDLTQLDKLEEKLSTYVLFK